jgi:hypothetical protein
VVQGVFLVEKREVALLKMHFASQCHLEMVDCCSLET